MQHKQFFIALAATEIFLLLATVLLHTPLNLDYLITIIGVVFLSAVTILSYFMLMKTANTNPRKFVNSMMLSTMLKLFGCGAAAFVLILATKPNIPRNSILFLMLAYIAFAVIESRFVMQYNRNIKQDK
ncbi:MAG: hypothetical protein RL660_2844 [Bacteroidota bacterium]|jgi:hypothetical protein